MKRLVLWLVFSAALFGGAAAALPELGQVAVIANKNSTDGVELARYYITARGLDEKQLVLLDLPLEDTIEREAYDSKFVAPLRKALEEKGIAGKVRILVTTYGVPLRIAGTEAKGDEKQALLEALSFRKQSRTQIEAVEREALAIAGKKLDEKTEGTPEASDADLVARARAALNEAVNALAANPEAAEAKAHRQKVNDLLAKFGGLALVAQSVKVNENASPEAKDALAKVKHDVQSAFQILQALDETRTAENRKRGYALGAQVFGAAGILGRANAYLKLFEYKDADASVESELSFLWWERDQYVLSERIPSPLHHKAGAEKPFPVVLPLLLAARIDGADAKKARGLIDGALAAEKDGLRGKAYIDARGLKAEKQSFGLYDQNLRELEDLLDDKTDFDVELENTDKRFDEPGDAPDTAIYAGWYRLRHYEDAFTFKPGAIGVHVASEEARSLHDPNETGWCKNAIDRGITATMGAVGEPYLDSFPLPLEFFGLLLSAKYSLIEAYALTNPYLSWRMTLLGDPLYRPFQKRLVEASDLVERSEAAKTLDPYPPSPLERDFPDPIATRKQIAARREKMAKEIDVFYKQLQERLKEKKK